MKRFFFEENNDGCSQKMTSDFSQMVREHRVRMNTKKRKNKMRESKTHIEQQREKKRDFIYRNNRKKQRQKKYTLSVYNLRLTHLVRCVDTEIYTNFKPILCLMLGLAFTNTIKKFHCMLFFVRCGFYF